MFTAERRERILEMLQQQGRVTVSELTAAFGVSDDTIRIDLKQLEEHRLLVRTYGGALPVKKVRQSQPYGQRLGQEYEDKHAIARRAAALVQHGETILLEGSTTTRPMADYLPDNFGLTVITNSPDIATALAARDGLEVILLGGRLDRMAQVATGPMVIEQMHTLRVDRAFFSTSGFIPSRGATSASVEDAFMKKAFLSSAKQSVLLVTRAKYGQEGLVLSLPLDRLDVLVTVQGAPEDDLRRLDEKGLKVIIA